MRILQTETFLDVDTLEAPYDTPEVVNPLVDYANDMRSPFTATPVPRGSMSSRTGRKTWGDSQNDIRSNSKSRTRLPSEDLTLNGDKGCISARVAPNGVALIIGEETNELKVGMKKMIASANLELPRNVQKLRNDFKNDDFLVSTTQFANFPSLKHFNRKM